MKKRLPALLMVAVLLAATSACSLPFPPTGTPTQATLEVEVPSATLSPMATEPPTATVAPPPTEPPPAPEPIVVTHQDPVFNLYTLDGTLVGTRPATGLHYARPGTAQVVGDAIYYVDGGDSGLGGVVRRVTSAGSEELAFTRADVTRELTFKVSPDQSMIAWANNVWQESGAFSWLWIADINGGGLRQIAQSVPGDPIPDFYVLEPVTWLPGGDLVLAWQISGIGGYILFSGYSSLYRYSPSTRATTPLVPLGPEIGALCWSTLSPDGAYAVGACDLLGGVVERDLATGTDTVFPVFPDQGRAGAAAYSPSGARLAYAIARGNEDNEAGQVIVRLRAGEAPVSIASRAGGYFNHILWADEERLVVEFRPAELGGVELLRLDGTRNAIGAGHLIGVIRP